MIHTGPFGDYWKSIVMEGVYFWIYDEKPNTRVYALKIHRNNYASIYSSRYTYGIRQLCKFKPSVLMTNVFIVVVI